MLNYIPHDVIREDRADGSILLRSRVPLGPVAKNTGEWLHEWAQKAPERVFVAERSGQGWREVRYAELLAQVRAVASSLLARGLGPENPIVVISSNSVDHAILASGGPVCRRAYCSLGRAVFARSRRVSAPAIRN